MSLTASASSSNANHEPALRGVGDDVGVGVVGDGVGNIGDGVVGDDGVVGAGGGGGSCGGGR